MSTDGTPGETKRAHLGSVYLIVWLASFPRSGNTFFRIALERLYGTSTRSLYADDPANIAPPEKLEELKRSPEVHFIKTHELPTDESPAVLLIRDGRDAMISFAHFIQDYGMVRRDGLEALLARLDHCKQQWLHGRPPFEQLLRRVIEGEYFDWSAHYRAWRDRPAPCAVVTYESLVADPLHCVPRSLENLGLELELRPGEALPDFATLHAQDPKFYRAGKSGQWRTEMSPETEELFWQRHGEAMRHAGYER